MALQAPIWTAGACPAAKPCAAACRNGVASSLGIASDSLHDGPQNDMLDLLKSGWDLASFAAASASLHHKPLQHVQGYVI